MYVYEFYDILSRIPSPNSDNKTKTPFHEILISKLPREYQTYVIAGWKEIELSKPALKFLSIYETLSANDRIRDVKELKSEHPSWF